VRGLRVDGRERQGAVMAGSMRVNRAVLVIQVVDGVEVGARRLDAGAEVVIWRRWERRGTPFCRGEGRRSVEFVAPVQSVEAAVS
jgi:hypothetical protein